MPEKVDLVEEYLIRNLDNLDLVMIEVVKLLPDSYFYRSEIKKKEAEKYRIEIDNLIKVMSFKAYQGDANIKKKYRHLVKEYENFLVEIAVQKRKEFLDWYQDKDDEIMLMALYNLITHFKLLKWLRTFNND